MLNEEQQRIFAHVVEGGKSCKVCGPAGTGKSFLLEQIIKWYREHGKAVAVAAPTWVAASRLNGSSIHRLFGINPGIDPKTLYLTFAGTRDTRNVFFPILKHIRTLSFVIIDECSMLDYYLLKYIDLLCKTVKRTSDRVPFGGIQMMICGDFFQLPCITDRARPVGERFCFQTDVWNEIGPTFQLQTVVRQNEEKLVRILHKIRAGAPDEEVATFFESRTVPDFSPDDEQYAQHTVILPLRREVDAINSSKLAQVAVGKEVLQWAAAAKNAGEQEFGNTPANIVLCVGLRVMVTANVDPTNGIYNGAKGTIVDMVPASATVPMVRQPWFHNDIEEFLKQNQKRVPVVLFDNGERRAIGPHVWYSETKKKKELLFCQLPIILAYAITVHKCQSATIDNIVVDLRNCFEDGMVYVAVSRCTRTDGIVIIGFDMSKISANEQCVRWAEAERRRLAVGTNDEEPASRL